MQRNWSAELEAAEMQCVMAADHYTAQKKRARRGEIPWSESGAAWQLWWDASSAAYKLEQRAKRAERRRVARAAR